MKRSSVFALGALAGLALGSPAFAFSAAPVPTNSPAGAKFVDPDAALSARFDNLVGGSSGPISREAPAAHGPMVIYDVSTGSPRAAGVDGQAALAASPGDSRFNPFMASGR